MISARSYGSGCPVCAKEYKTSFPEQAVLFYLKKCYDDCINGYKPDWVGNSEIDIFILSRNVGIEYDGRAWHKSYEKDLEKNRLCAEHGIKIYRLREPGIAPLEPCVMLKSVKHSDLSPGIRELLLMLGIEVDVDVERDKLQIYELMEINDKKKSLATEYPEIAVEWDYEKNYPLTPQNVTYKSGKSVYWICPLGHSFKTDIDKRTVQNVGCPYCSNKKVLPGFNDLLTIDPVLAGEWDHDKNGLLDPSKVVAGSRIKAWWLCERGHSYQATIQQRVRVKSGCPYCAGQRAIPGETDLKTICPELAEYWDYGANGDKKPEQYLPKSSKTVCWKCMKCGNAWKASIKKMANRKYKCQECLR